MNNILKFILILSILHLHCVTAKRDIYIAGLYPGSGGWFVPLVTVSAQLALNHINNRSDILKDYNLIIDWKDTMCTGKFGLTNFIDYLYTPNRKYVCVYGPGCSVAAVEVALIAEYYNLATISYSATSPSLSNTKRYKYFVRTIPPDTNAIPAKLSFILEHGWKRVGIISEEEDIFTSAAFKLMVDLEANQIKVQKVSFDTSVIQDEYDRQIEGTFRLFTTEGYRVIVTNMYQNAAMHFLCRLYKYQLSNKLPYITWIHIGWYTAGWYNETPEITNGSCTAQNIQEMANGAIGFVPFLLLPDFNISNYTTISGYTPQELYAGYKQIAIEKNYDFYTLYDFHDPYAYDGVWNIALALNRTIQNGFNIEEQNYTADSSNAFAGEIYESVLKQEFIGWTGPIAFAGNDRFDSRVRVLEFVQGDIIFRGLYSNTTRDTDSQENNFPFEVWNKDLASDGKVEFYSHPSIFPIVTILSFFGAIYTTILIIFILTATIKKLPPTTQSGPGMNIFILCGTYFLFLGAIRFSMIGSEDYLKLNRGLQELYCYSKYWLYSLALDIIFGGIIIKASKYYLIWVKNKLKITVWYLIALPIALAIIDTICTIIGIFMAPIYLVKSTRMTDDLQNPFLSVETCIAESQALYIAYLLVIYIPKIIILIIGLSMAYHLRRIVNKAQKYSRIIVWAMYNSVLFTILIICLDQFIADLNLNAVLTGLFTIVYALLVATIISAPVIYNTVRDPRGKKLLSYGTSGEFPEDTDWLKLRIKTLERDLTVLKTKDNNTVIFNRMLSFILNRSNKVSDRSSEKKDIGEEIQ